MAVVFIPEVGHSYRVQSEWKPELDWTQRNLVLFRELKLTGTKEVSLGSYYKYDFVSGKILTDDNGNYIREERTMKRTVPNPLFQADDGEMVPVTITFPQDTVFELRQLKTGHNNTIREIWCKIVSCSDKRFTKRVFSITVEQMNGAELELVE